MIEIHREDLTIKGVVIQTDIHELAYGQWTLDQQQNYFIDNKHARQINDSYFLIEDEKTLVYKLLDFGEQPKQNDDAKEQFLIIKLEDMITSFSYFGVLLDKHFREQFQMPLPFSTFLIEQFIEQIKNWNEKKNTFIKFEKRGDSFNVQYLDPTFLFQEKITPLEINIHLAYEAGDLKEQRQIWNRKIFQLLNENNVIIEQFKSKQDSLQQFVETENKLKQALSKLEAEKQKFEQTTSKLLEQNHQLVEEVRQAIDTKKSQDSHLQYVIQKFNQHFNMLVKLQNKKQKPHTLKAQKIKPILQKFDDYIYQSNEYQLEVNKPLEFKFILKDLDQLFKIVFTDLYQQSNYYDVVNEDFTYKFEYPSGKFKKGDHETLAYEHPFGYDDQISFVLLDDGDRKTLQYRINGVERPVIRFHGSLSEFHIIVKFDNDNIPLDKYVEFID